MVDAYTSTSTSLPLSSAATEPVLAMGMTATQWVQLLDSDAAKSAKKSLDYYDGKQLHQMIITLNDIQSGRAKWRQRGMIPRFRNLTKMIVTKSGMLFKDAQPTFEVYAGDSPQPDERQTKTLTDELWKIEWAEFCINLDEITRLLKTSVVLVQYDEDQAQMTFDILTRANSCAVVYPGKREIEGLIYVTSSYGAKACYRVLTEEFVYDLEEVDGKVAVAKTMPNPYGEVTASPFYDTGIPRSGFWIDQDCDIVQLNEMYNLSLTDSEFCIAWQKKPTLFTNMKVDEAGVQKVETVMEGVNKLPTQMPSSPELLAGPSTLVTMDSAGVDGPFIKYDGPDVNLSPLDQVVEGWVKSFASDWAVRVKVGGDASASSGFQLVVEEMDNLELRKVRQRMFENGFKRLFHEIKCVMNYMAPGSFSENAELDVIFNEPYLPVEKKDEEAVWSVRIAEGRATEIDYFMQVLGLTEEEAKEKYAGIVKFKAEKALLEQQTQKDVGAGQLTSSDAEDDDYENDPVGAGGSVKTKSDVTTVDSGGHLYPTKPGSKTY